MKLNGRRLLGIALILYGLYWLWSVLRDWS